MQGQEAAVEAVVNALNAAMAAHREQRDEEAHWLLGELAAPLDKLLEGAQRMRDTAKAAEDHSQLLLERVIAQIGVDEQRAHTLQQQILEAGQKRDQSKAAIEQDEAQIRAREAERQTLMQEAASIRAQIDRDNEEAATYWWVPGYNLYLAGRALAHALGDKNALIDSKAREFEELGHARDKSIADEQMWQTRLQEFSRQIAEELVEDSTLKGHMTELQRQNEFYAKQVTTAEQATTFYAQLQTAIRSLSAGLTQVELLADKLTQPVETTLDDGAGPETLADALRELGRTADLAATQSARPVDDVELPRPIDDVEPDIRTYS